MSYSHTVPPKSRTSSAKRRSSDLQEDDMQQQQETRPAVQSYSSGGYHVIAPHSQRNSKLKQVAKQEDSYQRYKESKKELVVAEMRSQGPYRLGGPMLTSDEIQRTREKQEKELKKKVIQRQIEREERREEYDRKEKEKIEEFKKKQREKSERLSIQKSITDAQRQEEVRRKRLAYYDQQNPTS